tara:strand:+ start:4139 stop:4690 length:552 start_codon:yes stop_codon:yes gene_type:complete
MEKGGDLEFAAETIERQGVIAYPTEGVWGLGCDPYSERAVHKLLTLKKRPVDKGLLLVATHIGQFDPFLEGLERKYYEELDRAWPGPTSYLVPDNGFAPRWIIGTHKTLGLRISDHSVIKALCELTGPLVSTSANISGSLPMSSAEEIKRVFSKEIDYVLHGELGKLGRPTQIKNILTGKVLR